MHYFVTEGNLHKISYLVLEAFRFVGRLFGRFGRRWWRWGRRRLRRFGVVPFLVGARCFLSGGGGVATLAVLGGVARFLFHDDRGGGVGGVATLLGSVAFGVVALFALLFALLLTTIKVIF